MNERQSARMSKIENGGLDQYGAKPFEQQQFGTASVEGVNRLCVAPRWAEKLLSLEVEGARAPVLHSSQRQCLLGRTAPIRTQEQRTDTFP